MNAPDLFPCAFKVKVPHVGADETVFKYNNTVKDKKSRSSARLYKDPSKDYIKRMSNGLSFSEEVVKERGFHTLPYDSKYFFEALDPSGIVQSQNRTSKPVGRHNPRNPDRRHMPCHLKKKGEHHLKPLRRKIRERAIEIQKKENADKTDAKDKKEAKESKSVFITESLNEVEEMMPAEEKSKWDTYLVSLMSQRTATWLVHERMSPDRQQEALKEFLTDRYGEPPDTDLIRDDISEGSLADEKGKEKKSKWRKGTPTILDKLRMLDSNKDESSSPFYRQPGGQRRAKKHEQLEQAALDDLVFPDDGAINATAHSIQVTPRKQTPPPTLKDFINPQVGDKVLSTDNLYQQERLAGGHIVHQKQENEAKILMASRNKYLKHLQKESPGRPQQWFYSGSGAENGGEKELFAEEGEREIRKVRRQDKGMHRWSSLPTPIDDTAEKLNLMAPGYDPEFSRSPEPGIRRAIRNNTSLTKIVDDWRSKWHLSMRYADSTPQDLIQDMADIHPHIRLKAIATCAHAAEYRPPPEPGIQLDRPPSKGCEVQKLPEEVFEAIACLIEDENLHVRRAAAIALFTLERPNKQAEYILRETLMEDADVDRWAAAQCLAHSGTCDSDVVGEMVQQLLNTDDPIRYEQAQHLLGKLSQNSMLVHAMLAEQLNSSSWRQKVMACKALPKLTGKINRDIVNKLTDLMWKDWHSEVRKAAAQTLGKAGHGKDVHDDLKDRLLGGNERERQDAVAKIGHLGIMTAKLLPVFLQSFTDSYVSIRIEACISSGNLGVQDASILDKLVHLATYDPIWKVKALAIQALGKIGRVTPGIRECLLWALRYEDKAGVRAEACHSVIALHLSDDDVKQILQDRFLVETSNIVKDEIMDALEGLGISPGEDMDMVAQVKKEVRKLCTRDNICSQITVNEKEDNKQKNIERMIYQRKQQLPEESEEFSSLSVKDGPPPPHHHYPARNPPIMVTMDDTVSESAYTNIEESIAEQELTAILTQTHIERGLTPENEKSSSMSRKAGSNENTSRSASTVSGSSAVSESSAVSGGDSDSESRDTELSHAVQHLKLGEDIGRGSTVPDKEEMRDEKEEDEEEKEEAAKIKDLVGMQRNTNNIQGYVHFGDLGDLEVDEGLDLSLEPTAANI